MSDEKILEGLIHSIEKPSSIQIDDTQTDWLLGQRIVELQRETDKKNILLFFDLFWKME